jgi:cellulose synthase/poly-beta-1,6-N-acetylglucosamine synthase-like glycosyltransferase
MSDLTGDDVVRLRQFLRREDEAAKEESRQAGPIAVTAGPADRDQPAPGTRRWPDPIAAGQQVEQRVNLYGPSWLRAEPSATDTKDFPAMSACDQSVVGRHRPLTPRVAADAEMARLSRDMKLISGGSVRKMTPGGPVLARGRARRQLRGSTFRAILSPGDRILIAVMSICWLVCLVDFWVWWLEPVHRTSLIGLVINSIVLAYVSCNPAFFVLAANHQRLVNKSIAVPLLRTAFVVTRAPSEPWDVARSTLSAMLSQEFPLPYDVWLCDERPSMEIIGWCEEHGVTIATRNGKDEYHRTTWPRRTKCKEGNLAYFYDHWGYRNYDVVAQLDCDQRPSSTYLAEIIRPFSDPAIGYVAAPSICDANADTSWAARGRVHREASFHGAYQLGHSAGWAPLCIGSHYAVRTRALRDIGGIGPELAEDFSTTYLLNTAGWQGAFAINAEAHGDGPNTFSSMLVQEFQWSRSLTEVMLGLVPRNLGRLPWRLRMRFSYALSFYTLLVLTTIGGLALAPAAAITGKPWINVNYLAFLAHFWSLSIWLILIVLLLRRRGLMRPPGAPILSWENWLYTLARWPYIAWGICSAVVHRVYSRPTTFRVTPKGLGQLEPLPPRLMVPYFILSVGSATAALIGEATNNAAGYVFLSMMAAFTYSVVCIAVPVLHAAEAARQCAVPTGQAFRRTILLPLTIGLLTLLPVALAAVRYPPYALHVFHL